MSVGHPQGRLAYWLHLAILLISLLLFSEALLGRLFASETNPEGGAFLRLLWLPLYAFAAAGMAVHWKKLAIFAMRSPFLIAVIGMAMCSMLWSIDPATSLRRGVAIVFTSFFGFYLASALSWKEMLRLLGVVWLILAVGNFLAGALVPGFGVMHEIHPGAWRGLWFEKNAMGGNFARASFLFGFLFLMDVKRRKLWGFGFLLSAALVLFSTSKTSLLGLMLGVGILFMYLWMKRGRITTVLTIWFVVMVGAGFVAVLFFAPEMLANLIGRDLTLTGRTDIWEVLLTAIDQRPKLGYGYGVFWGEDSDAANRVRLITEWLVPTAHNGLFEVVLSIGWIGGGLFIADYLLNLSRSLATMSSRPTSAYAFGFMVLIGMFSISESVFLTQNNLLWVTYIAVASKLSFEAHERSTRKHRVKHPRFEPSRFPINGAETALRGRLH